MDSHRVSSVENEMMQRRVACAAYLVSLSLVVFSYSLSLHLLFQISISLSLSLSLVIVWAVNNEQSIHSLIAAIAQLGERQTEDLKVPGSIPGLGIDSFGHSHICFSILNILQLLLHPFFPVSLSLSLPLFFWLTFMYSFFILLPNCSVLLRCNQVGTWCSGITSASHAEGPGFKSQCVHILSLRKLHCSFSILPCLSCVFFSSFLLFESLFASLS